MTNECHNAVAEVSLRIQTGEYSSIEETVHDKTVILPKSGLKCLSTTLMCTDAKTDGCAFNVVLVTAYKGRFIKLRYTERVNDDSVTDTPKWLALLDVFDGLIKQGADNHAVDIYAVEDDSARLDAIKRKWVAAGEQVSVWDMPDYSEQYHKIQSVIDWCEQDRTNRLEVYETVCRKAVELKFEPRHWYYNLSCALTLQGKNDEAFEALEQSVAAGWDEAEYAEKDRDFATVTNDFRFAKLCGAMRAWNAGREHGRNPKPIDGNAASPLISGENVKYDYYDESYCGIVKTTNMSPVVYINRLDSRIKADIADSVLRDMICPVFPEEAEVKGCNEGEANIFFENALTIVASDKTCEKTWGGNSACLPAAIGLYNADARRALKCMAHNTIGVYSSAADYGTDGVDKFVGYFPWCVAYEGNASEADKFSRLIADIYKAAPTGSCVRTSFGILDVIRRSQKCVKSEADLMSGMAQRPVLRFDDIDVEKALILARTLKKPESPPLFYLKDSGLEFDMTPIGDLWDIPWDHPMPSSSLANIVFVAQWGEYTARFKIKARLDEGKAEWKLLQGDPSKVRIRPLNENGSEAVIEVDYHEVFETELTGGRKILTSRVDIGCFEVNDGTVSLPSIVSVFFSPNEKRVYDENKRLVSIDYTKRQIESFSPYICAKGDWNDVFDWNEKGQLTGWARLTADSDGRVATNMFTREGLVIDTRDALGRPKDVHRSMTSTWKQEMDPTHLVAGSELTVNMLGYLGSTYDSQEGNALETTLAWEYTYENDDDRFGRPHPKDPVPFRYRPELCTRAEFGDNSGFALPLLDQMEFGYYTHVGFRYDNLEDNLLDVTREDSKYALKADGLVPPSKLKKMKFCPWKASTNDLWNCDIGECEGNVRKSLMELADGVYRSFTPGADGEDDYWLTVGDTYLAANFSLEIESYAQLDRHYRRCKEQEAREVLETTSEEDLDSVWIIEEGTAKYEKRPVGKEAAVAMWSLRKDLYLLVQSEISKKWQRTYTFLEIDPETGEELSSDSFRELPSPAIGNTLISAYAAEPDAVNNFAVLLYCGIDNPLHYDERKVIDFLTYAARKGNVTAKYNLGVLYENRGEKEKAEKWYKEAGEKK